MQLHVSSIPNLALTLYFRSLITVSELRSVLTGVATIYVTGSNRPFVWANDENLPHKNNYSHRANERDRSY